MWLLESKAVFGDKRLWLRPGIQGIWGRTRDPPPGQYFINDTSISRKHLVIEVSHVKPGDCVNTDVRSEVTITDLETKIGTLLDGVSIRGQHKTLKGDKHEIKLGRCPHLLTIVWVPVVFTLSLQSKELRAGLADPLKERLEPLDIKYLDHYNRENTTHVLTQKRNTSKTLQALVNGRYIVLQDSFLNSVFAATAQGPNGEKSQLEENFDKYWPDELDYLPPQGKEPTQLPASTYSPDPTRQNIFEGYSFVFYDEAQYDNLLGPITNGGGKAFLKVAKLRETTVEEFVLFVKGIAGEKGLGEFEDGGEGKGVVVVRFQPKGPESAWYTAFMTEISQLLDHRPIEQSEFLEAILCNDASILRRPLEPAQSGTFASSFPAIPQRPVAIPLPTQQNDTAPVPPTTQATGRPRKIIASRFKGFDSSDEDDMDPVQTPAAVNAESQESSMFVSQGEQTSFVSQANPSQSQSQFPPVTGRKRPAPVDEISVMDQLAPTNAGLKRARIADQNARRERGEPSPPPPAVFKKPKPETLKPKTKKSQKEIDVLEVARQRREREAEIAEADRAALEASLDGIDINEIRNLAIVEGMAVRRSRSRLPAAHPERLDHSDRWQDEWNGRKNFKKFRRRGEAGLVVRPHKVIVGLVAVEKRGHGNDYWVKSDEEEGSKTKNKKGKGKAKDSRSRSQTVSVRRGGNSDSDVDMSDSAPPVFVRASTSRSKDSQTLADKTNVRKSQSQAQNKRPAGAPLKNSAPAKKAKMAPPVQDDDDDDSDSDDGAKFKFRRK